jgi:hypothetical protein
LGDVLQLPKIISEEELIRHYASLGLTPRKLRTARKAGKLKFVQIGRTVCYTEKAVADWLAAEERECLDTGREKSSKSEDGGSTAFPEARSGTPSVMTPEQEESAARASASRILRKQSSPSVPKP